MKNFERKKDEHRYDERVHGPFRPSEIRAGERISCRLKNPKLSDYSEVFEVWRLSPFGLEVLEASKLHFSPGDEVDAVLEMGGQKLNYTGTVVAVGVDLGKRRLISIRLDNASKKSGDRDVNKRVGTRWSCHHLFFPTVTVDNRLRFNDKMMFRVSDISAGGMRMLTSLRNKYAVVGTVFDASVQVPSIGDFSVKLRVVYVDVAEEKGVPSQVVGVTYVKPSKRCMSTLGQYVLQFATHESATPSPRRLNEEGFLLYSIADAMDYDVVRSAEEYRQVLELRSLAFRGVKGLGVKATPEDMADTYDSRSRILVCRYRERIVATLRLCFHGESDKFEEEQYVNFPENFPPRHLVVEASRAATHPDFRGNDLFINILRYTMLVTLQSGRRWIVQSTYTKLIPIYEQVGFKPLGIRCPHPTFPGEQLHLLLGDCQGIFNGTVGNPLVWNVLVPDIQHLFENNDSVKLSWAAKKRLKLYNALTPLYRFYEKRKLNKRMRRAFSKN